MGTSAPPDADTAAAHSDYLVRAAITFMVDLYSIAEAHVAYREKNSSSDDSTEEKEAWIRDGDAQTHRDVRAVPQHPGYLRVLDLTLDEGVSHLLSDAEDHLEDAYNSMTIAVELAHVWADQLGASEHEETRDAVRSALPKHILAHIIADRYAKTSGVDGFRFIHHREEGAHDALAATIVQSLEYMDALTRSRVEQKELSHGVVIASPDAVNAPNAPGEYPQDFQFLKRTPLLADGYQTALLVNPDGHPVHLLTPDLLPEEASTSPHDLGALNFLAHASKLYDGIGLMLRPGGSIVVFARKRPLYIRRSGQWRDLLWNTIRDVMVARYGTVGEKLFDTAIILTTSGKGGILAVLEDENPKGVNDKDRVDLARALHPDNAEDRAMPAEWLFHRLLPADDVTRMSPRSLAQLAGIDGATLIGEDGALLAYGAIVSSVQGRSEGARTAAARTLSEMGLVLRVSEDGPIQLFEQGRSILTV